MNKFIVLCGGEGSGKSTMIDRLKVKYPTGIVFTREPGGTQYAESIRALMFSADGQVSTAETQFGLAFAARNDHMHKKIIPALNTGHVISDRFDCCTFAYQVCGGEAPQLLDLFWATRDIFVPRKPDLYIFFDVPPAVGLARASTRKTGNNFFDEKKLPFHEAIYAGYKEFLKKVPHKTIDARQPIEDVWKDVEQIMAQELGK